MIPLKREIRHWSEILEMAVALFPDYTGFRWGKNWDSDEVWFYHNEQSYEIHWIEFCFFFGYQKPWSLKKPVYLNRICQN